VFLVVDQMRADYVERFRSDWRGGFHRFLTEGAWFRDAAYPYLGTVTCAGHATIATGAFPHTHGIFQNGWWDRARERVVTCTEDASARAIGYELRATGGDSAHQLLGPTLADEIRRQRSGRVVSLSLKDRSAIMLAGRAGDAVTWMSSDAANWITSSAFTSTPVPAVQAFVDANPVEKDYGKTWSRTLADAAYREPDDGLAEAPPPGWTRTFPHVLGSFSGHPDAEFRAQWERSPYADAYLGRFAAALVESLQLGKHEGVDVLAVGFSTPDLVGHAFGPQSQETRDIYVHLDETLGRLLDRLDSLVGRDQYVAALTGDHGVTDIPEQAVQARRDAGRINGRGLVDIVEQRAQAILGPGRYVAALSGTDVYFQSGIYQRLKRKPAALDQIVAGLATRPGIAKVFRSEQLKGRVSAADPDLRAAALSFVSGRSGDLIIVPKPGWIMSATGTTHGSATADDQRVPVLLMGRGIRPGEYFLPVTPADIAPTLAALCGMTMAKAEGHPLRAAMAGVTATSPAHR
jgi:predicted AlkP superfamily pyrophosphatase or phosphodiesterase